MVHHSRTPNETRRIAADFAKKLSGGNWVGLSGPLGSGKTTFVQGMVGGLLGRQYPYVSSPTFTLVHEYVGDPRSRRLIHVDLYRLDDPQEINHLSLEDYEDPETVMVIEWAEKYQKELDFLVSLENISPEERRITIS